MSQTRLYVRLNRADATRAFAAFDAEFEDDGLPLAEMEIDEAADVYEVSLYTDGDATDAIRRASAALAASGLNGQINTERLPDIDWVAKSLEGLNPVRAGRFLVHGAHDRGRRRIGDLGIQIEAGLAFGTGHHGTTAGCLETIEKVLRREQPRRALDLGTGSAVLAIGVAKMARIPVLATDIDPIAVGVARENIRLNGVSSYVHAIVSEGFRHSALRFGAPFDLIVANILARPLMRLAPDMARHLTPGGSLILSGILERQRDAVLAAYVGQRFRHIATLHRDEWVTIHLKR